MHISTKAYLLVLLHRRARVDRSRFQGFLPGFIRDEVETRRTTAGLEPRRAAVTVSGNRSADGGQQGAL